MAWWNNKHNKSATNTLDENYVKKVLSNFLNNSILWDTADDNAYIDKGYRQNPTVYSIINLIVNAANTVPLRVYEVKDESKQKSFKSMTSGYIDSTTLHKSRILKSQAFEETSGTALEELLLNPNPNQSQSAWLGEIIAFGKLTGNRYIWGISPETGENKDKPTELYVLPSQHMNIVTGGINDPIKGYTLDYNGTNSIPANEICHIKDFNPNYDMNGSHFYGQSPLLAGARTLQTNNQAISTGAAFLTNQTARGVLVAESDNVGEQQAKQLKDTFDKQYKGKAGDIAITAGKYSWINFGLSSGDLELLQQYEMTIKDICNLYGVPVEMLNNTDGNTYNSAKEKKKSFWQNAVIPELIKIRDDLNKFLAEPYSVNGKKYYIDFDFSEIPELQEDLDTTADRMAKSWWVKPNEKRAAMGYSLDEEVEEMNEYYIPANLVPIDESDILLENPQPIKDGE